MDRDLVKDGHGTKRDHLGDPKMPTTCSEYHEVDDDLPFELWNDLPRFITRPHALVQREMDEGLIIPEQLLVKHEGRATPFCSDPHVMWGLGPYVKPIAVTETPGNNLAGLPVRTASALARARIAVNEQQWHELPRSVQAVAVPREVLRYTVSPNHGHDHYNSSTAWERTATEPWLANQQLFSLWLVPKHGQSSGPL